MKLDWLDIARFWSLVEVPRNRVGPTRSPRKCWRWKGGINAEEYGRFWISSKKTATVPATHVALFLFDGTRIRKGYELDHLCRNHWCVNPLHLEVVTKRVNRIRGIGFTGMNARKKKCPNGHLYDRVKFGRRSCSTCSRIHGR